MMDVKEMSVEELRQILREDAHSDREDRDYDFLFRVMEELDNRCADREPKMRSTEEAWQIFLKYYAPRCMRRYDRKRKQNRS